MMAQRKLGQAVEPPVKGWFGSQLLLGQEWGSQASRPTNYHHMTAHSLTRAGKEEVEKEQQHALEN